MSDTGSTIVRFAITITPEALGVVREALEKLAIMGDTTRDAPAQLSRGALHERVAAILRDGKIDALEAPDLFQMALPILNVQSTMLIGPQAAEMLAGKLRKQTETFATSAHGAQKQFFEALQRIETTMTPLSPAEIEALDTLRKEPLISTAHAMALGAWRLLAADPESTQAVLHHLSATEEEMHSCLQEVHLEIHHLQEAHLSPREGLTWRNWFGLWTFVSDTPPSARQIAPLHRLDSYLTGQLGAIRAFRRGIETGYFVEQAPLVQEFFAGPFRLYAHLDGHLQGNTPAPHSMHEYWIPSMERLARIATQYGAIDIADYWKSLTQTRGAR